MTLMPLCLSPPHFCVVYAVCVLSGSRDSSVGIATGYGLDDQGGGSSIPGRVNKFSLLHIVQTGPGVHPTSYKMGTRGSFPGVKRQGREADQSSPTSAEVQENVDLYTHSPIRLHGVVLN
jgi:hypothetical protein